jgi:hypothetical protein
MYLPIRSLCKTCRGGYGVLFGVVPPLFQVNPQGDSWDAWEFGEEKASDHEGEEKSAPCPNVAEDLALIAARSASHSLDASLWAYTCRY